MREEEFKTPWQIEHEKMLTRKAAEEKAEQVKFLRKIKLTRKSVKNFRGIIASQADELSISNNSTDKFEEENLSVSEDFYESDETLKTQELGIFLSSVFAPVGPIFKKLWLPLACSLVVFLGSVYALSPFNRVGDFVVTGNTEVTSSKIAEASKIRMDDTIFYLWMNRAAVEAQVMNSSARIKKANLKIDFPNKLTFQVNEHQSIGFIRQNGKNYAVLSNGSVARDSEISNSEISDDSLILEKLSNSQIRKFVQTYQELPSSLQTLIRVVTLTPTQSTKDFITLEMADGNRVKVSLSKMAENLPYYLSIAENLQSPETVDMEVGIFSAPTAEYDREFEEDTSQKSSSSSSRSSSSNDSNLPNPSDLTDNSDSTGNSTTTENSLF